MKFFFSGELERSVLDQERANGFAINFPCSVTNLRRARLLGVRNTAHASPHLPQLEFRRAFF
jgi:hypothetical protein